MSKSRKPRPSFAPSATPVTDSQPAAAGWVYRTGKTQEAPDVANVAGTAAQEGLTHRSAGRRLWLDAVTFPMAVVLVATLQPVSRIDRWWRSRMLAFAFAMLVPALASAQTPGAVSTQIGTIAEQMIMRPPSPWLVQVGVSGDMEAGNADRSRVGGQALLVRDWTKWRFATTLAAGHETAGAATTVERYQFDLAFSRPLGDKWRAVLLNDYARSPFDGLAHQNATGGVLVWLPDSPEKLGLGVFGGAAYAIESYTLPVPDQKFMTSLAGVSATYFFTHENTLAMLLLHSADLSDSGNFRTGGRAALNTRIAGGFSLQLTYEIGYDHEPVARLDELHQTLSFGVTLRLAPKPPTQKP